jgi:thiosulfate/3-mercaptopyruvate sulfurtransferase
MAADAKSAFGPLVSADWLVHHVGDVCLVDVRWYLDGRSGRDAYEAGHLPGAVWLDIDTDLSEPASTEAGRHPLASPERFANALGRVGIAPGTFVVAYDDSGGSTAARLWWMLHVLGEPVAVLDGGIAAWPDALSTAPVEVIAVPRAPVAWPSKRFVDADQVAALIASRSAVVVDARAQSRYAAGDPAIDPRGGHIPRAVNAPWADNLTEAGTMRPAEDLAARYELLGAGPVVAYCGSGVTACLNLLALAVAGREATALYPGSWSQWGADPARPAELNVD